MTAHSQVEKSIKMIKVLFKTCECLKTTLKNHKAHRFQKRNCLKKTCQAAWLQINQARQVFLFSHITLSDGRTLCEKNIIVVVVCVVAVVGALLLLARLFFSFSNQVLKFVMQQYGDLYDIF